MKDLELADSGNGGLEVDILLGADVYWEIVSGNMRRGENYGPVTLGSKLGWTLSGPVQVNETEINTSVNFIQASAINTHFMRVETSVSDDVKLNETLKAFWELESIGTAENEKSVYDKFEDQIKFENNRPWGQVFASLSCPGVCPGGGS